MLSCANCPKEAVFRHLVSSDTFVAYCAKHLPKFLSAPRYAGRVTPITAPEPVPEVVAEVKPSKKKAVVKPVVEEPVVEEPVVEDSPELVETPEVNEGE